jgi:hypothetical protein
MDNEGQVLLEVTVYRPDGQAVALTLALDPAAYQDQEPEDRYRSLLDAMVPALLWACGDERYELTAEGLVSWA